MAIKAIIDFQVIDDAFEKAVDIDTGKALLSKFSEALRGQDPAFDHRNYGFKTFGKFCEGLAPNYQTFFHSDGLTKYIKEREKGASSSTFPPSGFNKVNSTIANYSSSSNSNITKKSNASNTSGSSRKKQRGKGIKFASLDYNISRSIDVSNSNSKGNVTVSGNLKVNTAGKNVSDSTRQKIKASTNLKKKSKQPDKDEKIKKVSNKTIDSKLNMSLSVQSLPKKKTRERERKEQAFIAVSNITEIYQ